MKQSLSLKGNWKGKRQGCLCSFSMNSQYKINRVKAESNTGFSLFLMPANRSYTKQKTRIQNFLYKFSLTKQYKVKNY